MRVYMIKHKGASRWYNMLIDRKFTFVKTNKIIYVGIVFYRKKDAKAYLETLDHPEYFEIIGATVDKSKYDNRTLQ